MSKIARRDLLTSGLALSASSLAARSAWGRVAAIIASSNAHLVLVEAESFTDIGGWVIDQEFSDHMGSAFLLAHGMGAVPVADARTHVDIPAAGTVPRVWVRTRRLGCPVAASRRNLAASSWRSMAS